jgi:hypothetical protein
VLLKKANYNQYVHIAVAASAIILSVTFFGVLHTSNKQSLKKNHSCSTRSSVWLFGCLIMLKVGYSNSVNCYVMICVTVWWRCNLKNVLETQHICLEWSKVYFIICLGVCILPAAGNRKPTNTDRKVNTHMCVCVCIRWENTETRTHIHGPSGIRTCYSSVRAALVTHTHSLILSLSLSLVSRLLW